MKMLAFKTYPSRIRSNVGVLLALLAMVLFAQSQLKAQSSVICTYEPDSVWRQSGLMESEEAAINRHDQILIAAVNSMTTCYPTHCDTVMSELSFAERAELNRLKLEEHALLHQFEDLSRDFASKAHQESTEQIGIAAERTGKQCGCMATWPKSMVLFGPVRDISNEVKLQLKADSSR